MAFIPTVGVSLDPTLAAAGLAGQPFAASVPTSQAVLGSGTIRASLQTIPAGVTVNSLACQIGILAVGAVPTLIRLGLYDLSGNLLASTPNLASDARWTAAVKACFNAVSTPFTVKQTAAFYVAMLQVGVFSGTDLQIVRASAAVATSVGWPNNTTPSVSQAGQSDLTNPATFAPVSGQATFWLAAATAAGS